MNFFRRCLIITVPHVIQQMIKSLNRKRKQYFITILIITGQSICTKMHYQNLMRVIFEDSNFLEIEVLGKHCSGQIVHFTLVLVVVCDSSWTTYVDPVVKIPKNGQNKIVDMFFNPYRRIACFCITKILANL